MPGELVIARIARRGVDAALLTSIVCDLAEALDRTRGGAGALVALEDLTIDDEGKVSAAGLAGRDLSADVAMLRGIVVEATRGTAYASAAEAWSAETIEGSSAVGSIRPFLERLRAHESRERILERRDQLVREQFGRPPSDPLGPPDADYRGAGPTVCLSVARFETTPDPGSRRRISPLITIALVLVAIAAIALVLSWVDR